MIVSSEEVDRLNEEIQRFKKLVTSIRRQTTTVRGKAKTEVQSARAAYEQEYRERDAEHQKEVAELEEKIGKLHDTIEQLHQKIEYWRDVEYRWKEADKKLKDAENARAEAERLNQISKDNYLTTWKACANALGIERPDPPPERAYQGKATYDEGFVVNHLRTINAKLIMQDEFIRKIEAKRNEEREAYAEEIRKIAAGFIDGNLKIAAGSNGTPES